MIVKVLTVRQPWAELIVQGIKHIETRSLDTKYRGILLIHSSAKMTKDDARLCQHSPFNKYIDNLEQLELGYILGAVELHKTTPTKALHTDEFRKTDEFAFGDYSYGRFGWHLRNAFEFNEIIPAKGRLGLWDYEIEHPLIKEVCHA
jgi:hypothetical protein